MIRALVTTLLAALLCAGCSSSDKPDSKPAAAPPAAPATDAKPQTAAPAGPELPPKVVAMRSALKAANISVPDLKPLKGNTMPGCKEEFRARIYLGEPGQNDFVNVAHFATPEDATACLELYKASVLKAGQAAWDRLGPLISTHGSWLYLFSESITDPARRDPVLAELHKNE